MNPTDNPSNFHIYNASAGSGKTFLLVQKYLETLLSGSLKGSFQRALALTFTNKAVFEMKWRILNYLNYFTHTTHDELIHDPMAKNLLSILKTSPAEFAYRSKRLLQQILHDYAAFDIITLDSFTHRIIRSFAKELGLRSNFNVALGVELMLRDTVEDVVSCVGRDDTITKTLTQFTYARMDEGSKNWDLKESLFESSKLILNENDREAFMRIAVLDKVEKAQRFQWVNIQYKQLNKALTALGEKGISLCHDNNLEKKDFSYGTLYSRFQNVAKGDFKEIEKRGFFEKLQEGQGLYPKSLTTAKKEKIDRLLPQFLDLYTQVRKTYYRLMLVDDIRKQWVPLGLLSQMAKRLEERQLEENEILLSSFNGRIAKEILRHPVPYIYERLGEHYREYFIDEFQDTSRLQWENLIPLVENALVSEDEHGHKGSLLLVGDPKQSIYRWRGGDVNQFISLLDHESPFLVKQKIEHLDINYRSAQTIVALNNSLLNHLKGYLNYSESKKVFSSAVQKEDKAPAGGYVQLAFLPSDPETKKPAYTMALVDQITKCVDQGYAFNDMAVLVRKRKQAEAIAAFLSAANLPFVSSDALRIVQSDQVVFLVNTLRMFLYPEELLYKKEHLAYLYTTQERTETKHQYIKARLLLNINEVWKKESLCFSLNSFDYNDLYTVLESMCFIFPGIELTNPFVQNLLDCAFDLCQKETPTLHSFIDFWEKEGQFATLSMSDTANGVRVLTIHQAKGLEFPVVFFPFAEDLIHPYHRKRIWLDTSKYLGEEFPLAWVNFSKRVEHYGAIGKNSYHQIRMEEEIDAWNTFYVAITRPVDALYIYTCADEIKQNSYPHFLISFIEQQKLTVVNNTVAWGEPKTKLNKQTVSIPLYDPQKMEFDRYPFEKKLILTEDHDPSQQQSIDYGNLVHDLMAEINYAEEYSTVLNNALIQGKISLEEKTLLSAVLEQLIHHPQLSEFFTRQFKVLNEQAIVLHNGAIIRPDRIVYNAEKAIVIDYKTGDKDEKYQRQIDSYCREVREILKLPVEGYLVYFPKDKKENLELYFCSILNES